MAKINQRRGSITLKIVYDGLGDAPRHNLRLIYKSLSPDAQPRMRATETSLCVSFSLGEVRGYDVTFRLHSLRAGDWHGPSRTHLLKGVDGVVFVADADPRWEAARNNRWLNLKAALAEAGLDPDGVPLVLQVPGTDEPAAGFAGKVAGWLGCTMGSSRANHLPNGKRVFDSLRAIAEKVLADLASV